MGCHHPGVAEAEWVRPSVIRGVISNVNAADKWLEIVLPSATPLSAKADCGESGHPSAGIRARANLRTVACKPSPPGDFQPAPGGCRLTDPGDALPIRRTQPPATRPPHRATVPACEKEPLRRSITHRNTGSGRKAKHLSQLVTLAVKTGGGELVALPAIA